MKPILRHSLSNYYPNDARRYLDCSNLYTFFQSCASEKLLILCIIRFSRERLLKATVHTSNLFELLPQLCAGFDIPLALDAELSLHLMKCKLLQGGIQAAGRCLVRKGAGYHRDERREVLECSSGS